jgi:hypothetical protein
MTEALPTDTDTAKQGVAKRRLFLGVILVCLIIALIPACIAFFIGGSDKPIQSVDRSTLLIQQTPAVIQLSIPLSSRRYLQATLSANAQPKPNPTPQSSPVPTPMPTSMAHKNS